MRNMQLVLFITAFVLAMALVMPAYAQNVTDENVTYIPVSGTISFDPDNYNNVTSVTELTVYARNPEGFSTSTNPAANGSFLMKVPGNGTYSFWVYPSKLDYLNKTTNETYSVYYPDGDRIKFTPVVTDAGLSGITIPVQTIVTGPPMSVTPKPPSITPPTPTPTPTPTPGFTAFAMLAALGVMAAIAYRKR